MSFVDSFPFAFTAWTAYQTVAFAISSVCALLCLVAVISRRLTNKARRAWKRLETYTVLLDSLIECIMISSLLYSFGTFLSNILDLPTYIRMKEEQMEPEAPVDSYFYELMFNLTDPSIVCVLCGVINQFSVTCFMMYLISILVHHFRYLIQRDNALYSQRFLNRTILYSIVISTIMTILPIYISGNIYKVYGFNGTTCLLYTPSTRLWYILPQLILVFLIGIILLPIASSRVLKRVKRTGKYIYHGQYFRTVMSTSRFSDLIFLSGIVVGFGSVISIEIWNYILYSQYSNLLVGDGDNNEDMAMISKSIQTITFVSFILWSQIIIISSLLFMSKSWLMHLLFPSISKEINNASEYLRHFGPLIELDEMYDIYSGVKESKPERSINLPYKSLEDLAINDMEKNKERVNIGADSKADNLVKDEISLETPQMIEEKHQDTLTSTYDFFNIFCTTWNMGK